MALADYTLCDLCTAKAFYDAEVDWVSANTGEIAVLCRECAKTHTIRIVLLTPAVIRARGEVKPKPAPREWGPADPNCGRCHGRGREETPKCGCVADPDSWAAMKLTIARVTSNK